jgi:hypothetical protein
MLSRCCPSHPFAYTPSQPSCRPRARSFPSRLSCHTTKRSQVPATLRALNNPRCGRPRSGVSRSKLQRERSPPLGSRERCGREQLPSRMRGRPEASLCGSWERALRAGSRVDHRLIVLARSPWPSTSFPPDPGGQQRRPFRGTDEFRVGLLSESSADRQPSEPPFIRPPTGHADHPMTAYTPIERGSRRWLNCCACRTS